MPNRFSGAAGIAPAMTISVIFSAATRRLCILTSGHAQK
jgi:hypothetical protein